MTVRIIVGDCREALRGLESGSVQTVCTSPPYWGLRDYSSEPQVWGGAEDCEHEWGLHQTGRVSGGGDRPPDGKWPNSPSCDSQEVRSFCLKCGAWRGSLGLEPTPELFVQHLVEIFREAHRVLRDDGTLWLNLGSSYAGSGGASGKKVGHSPNLGVATWERYTQGVPASGQFKPKDLVPIPWMVAMALQADGWYLRSDIIWEKPNCMPASVRDRPTTSHEYILLLTKSKQYFYDQDAIREPQQQSSLDRYKYRLGNSAKAKLADREHVNYVNPNTEAATRERALAGKGRNKRTVWTIPTKPFSGAHFATFPPDLVVPCIKAGTSERGACPECGKAWTRVIAKTGHVNQREPAHVPNNEPTKTDSTGWAPTTAPTDRFRPACKCSAGDPIPQLILDPFGGSGTTGLVADKLGRDAVLIELNPDYAELSRQRILDRQGPMFTTVTMEQL